MSSNSGPVTNEHAGKQTKIDVNGESSIVNRFVRIPNDGTKVFVRYQSVTVTRVVYGSRGSVKKVY